jgi:hypothetical protein
LVAEILDRPNCEPIVAQGSFCGQAVFLLTLQPGGGPSVAKTSPPSTRKKVVIRRLDAEVVSGYLDPSNLLENKEIGLLDREGHLVHIPLDVVKGVYFVRDFEASTDRATLSAPRGHPRLSGIWIRMTLSDGEILEGLMPTNLMNAAPRRFMVTPADYSPNNLRIFVLRSGLGTVEVLGVIANGKVLRAD